MAATLTSPTSGSVLGGAIQIFTWAYDGETPQGSWLYAGSTVGGSQYSVRWTGVATTTSLGDLPTDGSTVHIRLWYRVEGQWKKIDETFVAAEEPALPFMTSPRPGGLLSGSSHRFSWDLSGHQSEATWLYVGTDEASSEYGAFRVGTDTEVTVTGLPTDSTPVHTRLYFRLARSWHFIDDVFTAAAVEPPSLEDLTKELQSLVGTTDDGIVGPQTEAALNRNWLGRRERFDTSFAERLTNDADVVSWVQGRISAQGGPVLQATGEFDTQTDAAVRSHLGRGGVVAAESFLRLLAPQLDR